MNNLKVQYMGIELKNPILVGSSGLTADIESIKRLEENGAGGVVLKSLFEEQIMLEAGSIEDAGESINNDLDASNYIKHYVKQNNINDYLTLIEKLKNEVSIPVIASLSCVSPGGWTEFTKSIEKAGADALELNLFVLPADETVKSETIEQQYFEIIQKVRKEINIPLAVKISPHFSGIANIIVNLSKTGISGIVLFNRFFNPDIDIEKMQITSSHVFSKPEELSVPLRWIGLLSDKVKCDLAATTGIYDGRDVIKTILAGAACVEVVTALYRNGPEYIAFMLDQLQGWMEKHGYDSIDKFRGKMSQSKLKQPGQFERAQFMKYFSGHKDII